ncbi:MAG: tetratricopeptide repeat protein [bacterium]|nr:tetratricopeptide repeat protein [bacterium]
MTKPETQIITFYSYKGGVGRTMAAANAACQLALRHGHRVICIDWDLEAPGLHHYFGYSDEELAHQDGLLDYVQKFIDEVTRKGKDGSVPDLEDYLLPLKPGDAERVTAGGVRLMPCGRLDADYMRRVQDFNWDDFYREQHGYQIIQTFKKQLCEAADITLVDARAGQADIGTTPTVQLPDAVAIFFTSNRQNLRGAEEIARRLHRHPQRVQQGLDEPKLLLVPSRVFHDYPPLQEWMKNEAIPVFDRLVQNGVIAREDQPKGVWQCYLPIDPKYAVEESLAVLDPDPMRSKLVEAYEVLASALNNLYHGRRAWTTADALRPSPQKEVELRDQVARAVQRGDDEGLALAQYKLAQQLNTQHTQVEEALALLETSLAYNQRVDSQSAIAAIRHEMGNVRLEQRRYEEAWVLYEDALRLEREVGDRKKEAVTLHEMGNVRKQQREFDEAWALYEAALHLKREVGDRKSEAITVSVMGDVRQEQRKFDEAWALFEEALRLYREVLERRGEAGTLHEMGNVRLGQRKFDEAWALHEEARRLHREVGDRAGEAAVLHAMGRVRLTQGKFDEAWVLFEEALCAAREVGSRRGEAFTLHAMGAVRLKQRKFDEAWALFEESLRVHREVGNQREEAVTLCWMSYVRRAQSRSDEARVLSQQAAELAEACGDSELVEATRKALAEADQPRSASDS